VTVTSVNARFPSLAGGADGAVGEFVREDTVTMSGLVSGASCIAARQALAEVGPLSPTSKTLPTSIGHAPGEYLPIYVATLAREPTAPAAPKGHASTTMADFGSMTTPTGFMRSRRNTRLGQTVRSA
jgi:hypothetical protein